MRSASALGLISPILALGIVALIGSSDLARAQGVNINLDGISMNGAESQVETQMLEFFPPCVRNRITNNTTGAFTFSWPGAGPGGFSSRLFPGPAVGTQWEWDTTGSVSNLQSLITFKPGLGLPVFGVPGSGVQGQGVGNERTFVVNGLATLAGGLLSAESLGASYITFFSPNQTIATCGSSFVPGRAEQTLTNTSSEPITIGVDELNCCPAADQTQCDDGCQSYLTDVDNCGGCGIVCPDGASCNLGCCSGTSNCNGLCSDLQTSELNCGQCGNTCLEGESCVDGYCESPCDPKSGETHCSGGICADLSDDPDNCGECGNVCDFSECPTGTGYCDGRGGCACDYNDCCELGDSLESRLGGKYEYTCSFEACRDAVCDYFEGKACCSESPDWSAFCAKAAYSVGECNCKLSASGKHPTELVPPASPVARALGRYDSRAANRTEEPARAATRSGNRHPRGEVAPPRRDASLAKRPRTGVSFATSLRDSPPGGAGSAVAVPVKRPPAVASSVEPTRDSRPKRSARGGPEPRLGAVECSLIDFEGLANGALVGTIPGKPSTTFGSTWTAFIDFDDPPGDSNCCSDNEMGGCDTPSCEAAICEIEGYEYCCSEEWDESCAFQAHFTEACSCAATGNIANEPSSSTAVTYLLKDPEAGADPIEFDTPVQFVEVYYSASLGSLPLSLYAWSGPGGTGKLVDSVVGNTLGVASDGAKCSGDPTGEFCLWDSLTLSAESNDILSITLEGAKQNQVGFDNMTFCTGIPDTGACCTGENACNVTTPENCDSLGGSYQGNAVECGPQTCGRPFVVGVQEAVTCSPQLVPQTLGPGESATLCTPGMRAGREIFTTATIVGEAGGTVLARGPCAQIVGAEFDPAGFIPTTVHVWLTDESGDYLPQPGELLTLDFEILNVGRDPLLNPIAELRSPPNFFNPRPVTFLQATSAYPEFPGLADSDLGQCDPPTDPSIFPQTNLASYMVRLPQNQAGGATRTFQLVFQGTVPNLGAVTRVLPIPLGIGRACNPLASGGRPYDGLSGFLAPVDAGLVPRGYPVEISTGTFPMGQPIPLRLELRCGANAADPARFDPLPQIRSITQGGVELPLTGIHSGSGDPDETFFACSASECSFDLDTSQIPKGETVIEVALPDGRRFRAGLTISGP